MLQKDNIRRDSWITGSRSHLPAITPQKHVNIIKKVKVAGTWRFYPALLDSHGCLKDEIRVDGRTEKHTEGRYFIEWYEGKSRRRKAIVDRDLVLQEAYLKALEFDVFGSDTKSRPHRILKTSTPANCNRKITQRERIERWDSNTRMRYRTIQSQFIGGSRHGLTLPQFSKKLLISTAIDSYLKYVEPPQRARKTYDEYKLVLKRFAENCGKQYLETVSRQDCLRFIKYLYSRGNEARTVFNRIGIVTQFLKLQGITGLLRPEDKPRYVETIREIYQAKELHALFKCCDAHTRVKYLFFLLTGERDQEVKYTTWFDVDFDRKCVRITTKEHFRFRPKGKQEREIPVPASLIEILRDFKARQSDPNPHNLVFPNCQGEPDKRLLAKLKQTAYRGGLNCGHCFSKRGNRCSDGPHCRKWYLHKFRHTYATGCLENGVSIRTLQEWLGHRDLQSTMIYLKYIHTKGVRKIVDHSDLAKFICSGLKNSAQNS